jgi:hypothetical protein
MNAFLVMFVGDAGIFESYWKKNVNADEFCLSYPSCQNLEGMIWVITKID